MAGKYLKIQQFPPIFADMELVRLAEEIHSTEIRNPVIVELNVELPKAQKTF